MAPTMPNPLRNEILPRQELEQLSEIIDGEFEPIQRKEGRPKGRLGDGLNCESTWSRSMRMS